MTKAEKKEYEALLSLIVELEDGDDHICEVLLGIPKEDEICKNTCQNLNKECVKRFLKYYTP